MSQANNQMTTFIAKYARWRNVLILLGIVIVINILLGLSLSGNSNLKPLDLQFSYSAEQAYAMISAYNEQERGLYILIEVTLDVVYPMIYSLCLSFSLFLLFGNAKLSKVPLFLVVLELFENAGIVILLVNYPHEHPTLVGITSVFTSMKWLLAVSSLLLVLFGFGKRLFVKSA